ncbi:MAG: A/G-specific adenine glycosylase [Desulfobacteraceae bacterium]|nr:A/G-specific adenine glycosylase [Desulfobacteraceae bacterium]
MKNKKIQNAEQIRSALTKWYNKNYRKLPWRASNNPYHIWVSEMMLQQTQVNTVIPYYQRFLKRFPDIQALAAADLQDVLKLWEGLGYYSRARNFHKAAQAVVSEHRGIVPDDREMFLALSGVGDYIAAAVLSIAFDRPLAVVDGNVKRVFARLFEIAAPVNISASYKIYKAVANDLLDADDPATFNQAVMELGALVCKPAKPDCAMCPLSKWCVSFKKNHTDRYPVKQKKAPIPHHHMSVGVLFKGDKVLIVRRPEEKMLGGLWEFPGGRLQAKESAEDACIRILKEKVNLNATIESKLTRIRHAYTHFKITADIFICTLISGRVRRNGPTDHCWVTLSTLERYPFPTSNHKFISKLMKDRM